MPRSLLCRSWFDPSGRGARGAAPDGRRSLSQPGGRAGGRCPCAVPVRAGVGRRAQRPVGPTSSCDPDRARRILFPSSQPPSPHWSPPCETESPRPFSPPPRSPPSRFPPARRPRTAPTIRPATSATPPTRPRGARTRAAITTVTTVTTTPTAASAATAPTTTAASAAAARTTVRTTASETSGPGPSRTAAGPDQRTAATDGGRPTSAPRTAPATDGPFTHGRRPTDGPRTDPRHGRRPGHGRPPLPATLRARTATDGGRAGRASAHRDGRQQRLDHRRHAPRAVRSEQAGDLGPDQVDRLAHLAQQRPQPAVAQPARRRELGRQDRRVDDIEVEMDEHRPPVEHVREIRRPLDPPDAARVEQHPLAGVDVAHAAHHHARRVEPGPEPAVPDAAGRREAHSAEEAGRRRVGRVEVAVRVEPQDPRVGPVAD